MMAWKARRWSVIQASPLIDKQASGPRKQRSGIYITNENTKARPMRPGFCFMAFHIVALFIIITNPSFGFGRDCSLRMKRGTQDAFFYCRGGACPRPVSVIGRGQAPPLRKNVGWRSQTCFVREKQFAAMNNRPGSSALSKNRFDYRHRKRYPSE
jgi:hypothetical protein